MPVIVTPPSTIKVQIGNPVQPVITSTSTFVGATNVQNEIDAIADVANSAANTANASYVLANSVYSTANDAYSTANAAYSAANSVIATVHGDRLINNANTAQVVLDSAGALDLPNNGLGVIRSPAGTPVNIVSDSFIQLQWTPDVGINDPNSTSNTTNWVYVSSTGLAIENNINTANTKGWYFGTDGSLTFPDSTTQITSYNTASVLQVTGGEITGNLIVDGTLTALLDGGRF